MLVRLGRFIERSGVLLTTQFAYRKGLGHCNALLCVSHTLQSALESGQEARMVIIIIIYHDFLPTPRRGSHVKSGKTHTQSSRYTP